MSAIYYQLWYVEEKQQLFRSLDSLYTNLADAADLRVHSGEVVVWKRSLPKPASQEVKMQLRQFDNDIAIRQQALMRSLNVTRGIFA